MANAFLECLKPLTQKRCRVRSFLKSDFISEELITTYKQQLLHFDRQQILEGYRQCVLGILGRAVEKGLLGKQSDELLAAVESVYKENRNRIKPRGMWLGSAAVEIYTEAEILSALFGRADIDPERDTVKFERIQIYDAALQKMREKNNLGHLPLIQVYEQLNRLEVVYSGMIDNVIKHKENSVIDRKWLDKLDDENKLNYADLAGLTSNVAIPRFQEGTNLDHLDRLSFDQLATLFITEFDPLRASRDDKFLVRQCMAIQPIATNCALQVIEQQQVENPSFANILPRIRLAVDIEQGIQKSFEKLRREEPKYWHTKTHREFAKFRTAFRSELDKHRDEERPEVLQKLIKKAAHSSFSNRDFAKRLLADIAMVVLCFAMVGFGIGIGRKLAGTSFFFSNNKTNRQKALEKEVDALFKPRDPG